MRVLNIKKYLNYFTAIVFFSFANSVQADDAILSLTASEVIGFKQSQTVHVELEVKKTRDLHVAIQNMNGFNTIKRTMKRIKKSGNYHFEVPLENIKPGNYRIAAYLTPRGKDWNDRITQAEPFMFEVVNVEKYVKKTSFSDQDKVKFVDWPKQINGVQEATLLIKYEITQVRDLHIKLLDSENWKEYGALKFPLKEPGNFTLPLSNLTDDFPTGKYAWVVFLTPTGEKNEVSDKYGKHFILTDKSPE